jgi:hypothetical protein
VVVEIDMDGMMGGVGNEEAESIMIIVVGAPIATGVGVVATIEDIMAVAVAVAVAVTTNDMEEVVVDEIVGDVSLVTLEFEVKE